FVRVTPRGSGGRLADRAALARARQTRAHGHLPAPGPNAVGRKPYAKPSRHSRVSAAQSDAWAGIRPATLLKIDVREASTLHHNLVARGAMVRYPTNVRRRH